MHSVGHVEIMLIVFLFTLCFSKYQKLCKCYRCYQILSGQHIEKHFLTTQPPASLLPQWLQTCFCSHIPSTGQAGDFACSPLKMWSEGSFSFKASLSMLKWSSQWNSSPQGSISIQSLRESIYTWNTYSVFLPFPSWIYHLKVKNLVANYSRFLYA